MEHTWEKCEIRTIFCLENLKGRAHTEDLALDGRIMFELVLEK